MSVDLSNIPWWGTMLLTLASAAGAYFTAVKKAEATVQRTMLTQAVTRQQQLDERQDQMMDDLTKEISRLKDEQLMLRKELSEERATGRAISASMEKLREENTKLREGMDKLSKENKLLGEGMDKLSKENTKLREGMDKLTKENTKLREALAKFENEQNKKDYKEAHTHGKQGSSSTK